MVRRLSPVLAILVAAAGSSAAAQTAESVLEAYLQSLTQATYTAVERLQERQADGTLVGVLNEVRVRPGQERSTFYQAPGPFKGVVQTDDGHKLVIYMPAERRAYLYGSRAAGAAQRRRTELTKLRERFELSLVARETVAERPAFHLSFTPKSGRGPTLDVWIDSTEYVALRQDLLSHGRVWRKSEFARVNFQPGLGDDDFRFQPPDGVKVVKGGDGQDGRGAPPIVVDSPDKVRQMTGLRVLQPSYVPDDFALEGYLIFPPPPTGVFHRRLAVKYIRDGRVIMLNQGITAPGRRVTTPPPPDPTEIKPGVFFWSKHEIRLLLIGPRELDRGDLRRCAESVDWYDASG